MSESNVTLTSAQSTFVTKVIELAEKTNDIASQAQDVNDARLNFFQSKIYAITGEIVDKNRELKTAKKDVEKSYYSTPNTFGTTKTDTERWISYVKQAELLVSKLEKEISDLQSSLEWFNDKIKLFQ